MQEAHHLPSPLRFGVFELDVRAGELRKHGLRVRLQEQPFQVLAILLERSGEVVTREELQKRLWPADTFVDFDHGLNKAINKIREALGDSASSPRFVETVARRGYRFIAEVGVAAAAPVRSPELAYSTSSCGRGGWEPGRQARRAQASAAATRVEEICDRAVRADGISRRVGSFILGTVRSLSFVPWLSCRSKACRAMRHRITSPTG